MAQLFAPGYFEADQLAAGFGRPIDQNLLAFEGDAVGHQAPFRLQLVPAKLEQSRRRQAAADKHRIRGGEPFEVAETLHDELAALGVEVLLDDRNERPGVKFKDADLLGIPLRVTLGARGLKEGQLELKARDAADNEMIPLEGAAAAIAARVKEALA